MKYWIAVFTQAVWRDFQETNFSLLGFPIGIRERSVKPKRGDIILCCLLPEHRWIAALSVRGPTKSAQRLYRAHLPVTYRVKALTVLSIEHAFRAVRLQELVSIQGDVSLSKNPYEIERSRHVASQIIAELEQAGQTARSIIPPPSVPDSLIRACDEGECVAYIGSGLTAPGGMPTWGPFVTDLMEWSIRLGHFTEEYAKALREAAKQGQYNVVADTVVSKVGDPLTIATYLTSVFEKKKPPSLPRLHALRQIPFSALLTTNFDDLLERTFGNEVPVYTPMDAEELLATQTTRSLYILKLYGTLRKPETLLVSSAQFAAAIASNIPFSRYMQGLFVSRTLLFLGASLDGITTYLGGLDFRGGSQTTREHYALVPVEGTAWLPKADLLYRHYRIRVLPFSASSDFNEVDQFLIQLRDSTVESLSTSRSVSSQPTKSSRLKYVKLENIGPFENLELELDPHWNVIVGDNGVGKSAILKAIGVAITGEDSASYAHRFIRSGQRMATITCTTDQNTRYVTQILSKDGNAIVNCQPARMLEAEGWLALGFPALRMVTWQKAKEVSSEGAPRIHSSDMLPLLSGDPDPRMDSLKQWLFNLEYKIVINPKDRRSKIQLAQRRRAFSDVIKKLLPGEMLEFAGVDQNTKQVMIKTPEGILPVEAISQGATSFLGWVGVLLQRLYDLFQPLSGETTEPLKQFAFVLLDEIDAHMHPAWQRTVIEDVERVCPNAQFLATTHSPLIVGNLRPGQVYALRRGEPPRRPEKPLDGYRADQILTLPIFNLDTTMSVKSEKTINEYHELLVKPSRTEDEEQRLDDLTKHIGLEWPSYPETVRERDELRRKEEVAISNLKTIPLEEREKLVKQATESLTELL